MSQSVDSFDDGLGRELVNALTPVVRAADEQLESEGGGTRHWVRDCFLPRLGLTVEAAEMLRDHARPEAERLAKEARERLGELTSRGRSEDSRG
jgi:hypothetical protein